MHLGLIAWNEIWSKYTCMSLCHSLWFCMVMFSFCHLFKTFSTHVITLSNYKWLMICLFKKPTWHRSSLMLWQLKQKCLFSCFPFTTSPVSHHKGSFCNNLLSTELMICTGLTIVLCIQSTDDKLAFFLQWPAVKFIATLHDNVFLCFMSHLHDSCRMVYIKMTKMVFRIKTTVWILFERHLQWDTATCNFQIIFASCLPLVHISHHVEQDHFSYHHVISWAMRAFEQIPSKNMSHGHPSNPKIFFTS